MITNRAFLGCGFFAIFFVNSGISAIAVPYYQMVLGVDPFLLGAIFALPILLSAIISPWAGRVIDTHFNTVKARSRLIIASGWSCATTFGLIWMVPIDKHVYFTFVYLLSFFLLFFVAATFLTVVVRSLAYRSSERSEDITSVMGYTTIFEKVGSLVYFWMFPLAQSTLFTSLTMGVRFVGWFVAIVLIGILSHLAGYLCRSSQFIKSTYKTGVHGGELHESFAQPLNVLLVITVVQFGLIGSCVHMDFYVLVYYVSQGDIADGAFWKGVVSTAYAAFGLLSIPIVVRAANQFGHKSTLVAIYSINVANGVAKWWLYQPGMEYWLILDALLGVWVWTAMGALIPALLAKICHQNQSVTGFFPDAFVIARHNKAMKSGIVIALLSTGILVNLTGFDANLNQAQSEETVEALRLILSVGSALFSLVILILLRSFRLRL